MRFGVSHTPPYHNFLQSNETGGGVTAPVAGQCEITRLGIVGYAASQAGGRTGQDREAPVQIHLSRTGAQLGNIRHQNLRVSDHIGPAAPLRLNQNRVSPGCEFTPTWPPAASTNSLTTARPIPAPPWAVFRDFSTR